MPKTRQKHYHVKFSPKLRNRHNEIKTRIQALGMVFKGSVASAITDVSHAASYFDFPEKPMVDFSESDLTSYIHVMNNVIGSVYEHVPTSDLRKLIETLKQDAVKHITGDPHDPHLDVPTEAAFAKARAVLFPGGDTDVRVTAKQMHTDVLFRMAKFLEGVPKQNGGTM